MAPEFPLTRAFLEEGPLAPERFSEAPRLEETLRSLWEAGARAWPGVVVAPERFVRHLAAHLAPAGDASRLEALHATDLYLACACALGDAEALTQFDRHLMPVVAEVLKPQGANAAWVDDVGQVLRQKLFLGTAQGAPKIAHYSGLAPLKSWVRAVVARTARDLRRGQGHTVPLQEHELGELDLLTADPELVSLKNRYRRELKEAFVVALQALPDRDLNVLRFHLVEGLNIDRIGLIYGTHRATVARWIAAARTRLLEETRRILGERLLLGPTELDSILRLIRSELDLSVMRYLKQRPPER
ncbi:MAG TPA: hypothetical protein VF815_29595 [Myxococcaceae bacterium]